MVLSLKRGSFAEIKTQGKQTANGKQQTANSRAVLERFVLKGQCARKHLAWLFAVYCLLLQLTVCCLLFTVCSHSDNSNHSSSGFQ